MDVTALKTGLWRILMVGLMTGGCTPGCGSSIRSPQRTYTNPPEMSSPGQSSPTLGQPAPTLAIPNQGANYQGVELKLPPFENDEKRSAEGDPERDKLVPLPGDDVKPSTPNKWRPSADAETRKWTSIVLHHTATSQGSVESIHEAHLQKKWLGIGYHFVIGNGQGMEDGTVEATFRWNKQMHGAHAGKEEYNEHGIGVVLVGNFQEEAPTAKQLKAVKKLVAHLKERYQIPQSKVIGHQDVKATECPGKYFPLEEVRSSEFIPALGKANQKTPVSKQALLPVAKK